MCPTIIVIQFMSKLFRVFLYHLLLLDCILKILKFQKKYKGIIWIHQNFRIWRGTHYPTERCAICIAGSFWHLPFWLKQKQEYWFFLNFYRSTNCKSVNNIIRTCTQIFRKIIWFSKIKKIFILDQIKHYSSSMPCHTKNSWSSFDINFIYWNTCKTLEEIFSMPSIITYWSNMYALHIYCPAWSWSYSNSQF